MNVPAKRKTSLALDAGALDSARALGVNVPVVAEAERAKWLEDSVDAFAAQAAWHETHAHPLADIMAGPGAVTWKS